MRLDISITTPIIVVVNFLNFENSYSQFIGFVLLSQINGRSPLNDITWPKLESSAGIWKVVVTAMNLKYNFTAIEARRWCMVSHNNISIL